MSSVLERLSVVARDNLCIGGKSLPSSGDQVITVVNPTSEDVVSHVRGASVQDADRAVHAARSAFEAKSWSSFDIAARSRALLTLADRIESIEADLAKIVTIEQGNPRASAQTSVSRAVAVFRHFGQAAENVRFMAERQRPDGRTTRIRRAPVGVVAAITPWNGPLGTASLKLGGGLAAGCPVIIKPAPETPLSTLVVSDILVDLVEEGLLPEGSVSVLPCGSEVSAALVDHPGIDKVSFTGSTAVGKQIMATLAGRIGRVTLELGGKSAAIILDDAGFDDFMPTLVMGGCGNTGQMCFALTRVLVSERRHDEFVEAMSSAMGRLVVGDPDDPATTTGPLTTARQRERVEQYIDLGRTEGAHVVAGGGRPLGLTRGFFIEPTLFDGVTNSMRIAREEIFGPVLSVITYRDEDDAVQIANDSDYGLSGAVFTADVEHGYDVASRLRTGTVSVNCAVFDATMPFGGFKQSGLGREGGIEGIEDFTELQSVHLPS